MMRRVMTIAANGADASIMGTAWLKIGLNN